MSFSGIRRAIYPSLFFLLMLPLANGQSTIKGLITDFTTGEPLSAVIVYIPQTNYWTESDVKGQYSLKLGDQMTGILKIQKLGYETLEFDLKNISATERLNFNPKLKPIISQEVVVKDLRKNDESIIREKAESFALLPTANSNLESILPSIGLGVRFSAGGELSSQYSVRGGSYDENLVFINDFEILRPQLIRNGQQEGLTFPNPDLIRDLSFSSGGFEAKYGEKSSSVLDIKYKVPDSLRASVSGSLLGFSTHLEGSSGFLSKDKSKNFKFLSGFRYKTNQYLLNTLAVEGEYQPHFFDFQNLLSWDFHPNWQWSWIGNINSSRFSLIPESGSQAKGSLFFIIRLNTAFEGSESDYFNQWMTGTSLSYFPKNRKNLFYVKWISSLYRGQEAERFDVLGYYRLSEIENDQKDVEGREVQLLGTGTQHLYGRNYLDNLVHHHEIRSGIQLGNAGSHGSHYLQAGLNIRQELFLDRILEWERIDSAGYSIPYLHDSIVLSQYVSSQNQFSNIKSAFWLQDQFIYSISNKWKSQINAGIRTHYNHLNGEFLINPRLKIELIPNDHPQNLRLWLAGGLYPQVAFYREMRNPNGSFNEDLRAQKSWHLIAGLKKDFLWPSVSSTRFRWISEMYYKSMWDMVSYNLDNVRIRYSGQNDSEAYAIGWDNRIHGEFVPGVESWVNLSILRTREKLNGIQHLIPGKNIAESTEVNDVPRPVDQLAAISLFFQDFLPNRPQFKMHMQGTVASGIPYGFKEANEIFRNIYRLRPYHRVDIGFSYSLWDREAKKNIQSRMFKWLHSTRKAWVSMEVFNLLNTKNEASVRWIKTTNNYEFALPNYLTSRRINLRIRFDF